MASHEKNSRLNVMIVGGSLSGLMHGIMLKRLGHNVHILEQATTSNRHGYAAGISLGPEAQKFFSRFTCDARPYALNTSGVKIVKSNSNVWLTLSMPFALTSWDVLYYRLRAAFDSYVSEMCPESLARHDSDGVGRYDLGKRVIDLYEDEGGISLVCEDVICKQINTLHADLVIIADGANSAIRHKLFPDIQRQYVGYLAWRGVIPEAEVSRETLRLFDGVLGMADLNGTYMVLYAIPGPDGSIQPGKRLFNVVWYCKCAGDSEEFQNIMTDVDGHIHHFTMPTKKIRSEVWEQQRQFATKFLPRPYAELVHQIKEPFVTAVSEVACPRAVLFDRKVLLVGDALSLGRPNIGLSTNRAGYSAMRMEKVLKGEVDWEIWEQDVLNDAYCTALRAVAVANMFLASRFVWIVSELQYRFSSLIFSKRPT